MIYGERVRQARELNGLTQKELSEAAEVQQAAISQIESGDSQPTSPVLAAIAAKTGFPIEFFARTPRLDFPLGSLLFRQHKTSTARDRKKAHRWGEIIDEAADHLASSLEVPPIAIPIMPGANPVEAATATRSALGMSPDVPIPNLIRLVERAGVLVFILPLDLAKHQAYSLWTGEDSARPVVALMRGLPGDRQRFSLAHELGHLVLRHQEAPGIEEEAHAFAAELLTPLDVLRDEMHPPITLAGLAELKKRWGVAIQSLARRAKELGYVTDRQYRYLFQQMGSRGWRMNEPIDIPRERPRAFRQMAEMLYSNPIDVTKLARDLSLSELTVREILREGASAASNPQTTARIIPLKRSWSS